MLVNSQLALVFIDRLSHQLAIYVAAGESNSGPHTSEVMHPLHQFHSLYAVFPNQLCHDTGSFISKLNKSLTSDHNIFLNEFMF